jgi:catechol 2,3-dioxygenase
VPVVDDLTGAGAWLLDPEGNRLVLLDVDPEPWDATPGQGRNGPGRLERTGEPVRAVDDVRPRRLGHVLLWAADLEAQTRFLTDGLGMLLSDLGGDEIAFVRGAAHVADHHAVALARGTAPGFHHGAFEVAAVDELVAGAHRMADSGWTEGWGLGRHALGSNLFHYVRDPWGSFAEYFTDIDVIPADCGWVARKHPAELSLYRWGPDVPPYFMRNTDRR